MSDKSHHGDPNGTPTSYPPTANPKSACVVPLEWLPRSSIDTGFRLPHLDSKLALLLIERNGSAIHVIGGSFSYKIGADALPKPGERGEIPPCTILAICASSSYLLFVCRILRCICLILLVPRSQPQQFVLYNEQQLDSDHPLHDFNPSVAVTNLPYILLMDPSNSKLFVLLGLMMKPIGKKSLQNSAAEYCDLPDPQACENTLNISPINMVPNTYGVNQDGLSQYAIIENPTAACATHCYGNQFYVADGSNIRVVTQNAVSTMTTIPDQALASISGWRPHFCALATNPNGSLFALDDAHGTIVQIENNVMSILLRRDSESNADFAPSALCMLPDDVLLVLEDNGHAHLLSIELLLAHKKSSLPPPSMPSLSEDSSLLGLKSLPSDVWSSVAQYVSGRDLIQLQLVSRATRNIMGQHTRISITSSKANVSVADVFGHWRTQAPFLEEFSLTLQHDEALLIFEKSHPPDWPRRLHTLTLKANIAYQEDPNIFRLVPTLTKLDLPNVSEADQGFLESLPRGLTYLSLPSLAHGFPLHLLPPGLTFLNLRKAPITGADLELPAAMDPLLPSLKVLLISKSQIDDDYLGLMPQNVEELDLQDSEMLTDNGVASLPRKLTSLNIMNASNITNNSGRSFPIHLTSLDVNNNSQLSNQFIALLASMETHQHHLTELRIESSTVDIFALPHIEQLKNLTRLHVPFTFTKDIKQELIPRLPPELLKLDVSANRELLMPDTNAIGWSLPKNLTQLKWALQSSPFTEAHFAHLPSTLLTLDLKNCSDISPSGLATLQNQTPNLKELKITGAKTLAPSVLRSLPPSLTLLELPMNLLNALNNHNAFPLAHLSLVELNLASDPCRFDSTIFFVLPQTLTQLSIPHLKNVSPIHLAYLPNTLRHLSLPSATTLDDSTAGFLGRQLETLELNSCERVTPISLSLQQNLLTLKLGVTWGNLEILRQHLAVPSATDVLQLLPPSLSSLELPRLQLPEGVVLSVQELAALPNLDYLVVGSKDSFRGAPARPAFSTVSSTQVR